ncbi:hypothetical protein ABZS66_46870 [Dactylosporangium sp. NPDC005572]|uniref:hypothetical protein n=1 Tax=Dactylosporangium sp. NPDC005572 TaxID=3156889 RepID=UPI0033B46806
MALHHDTAMEYVFDWRSAARIDGWLLRDGVWRHDRTGDERPDERYVYLGSGTWAETWPHEPSRPPSTVKEPAFEF